MLVIKRRLGVSMKINWKKLLWVVGILYWLLPVDFFSDFNIGIGWLDDILVGILLYFLWGYIKHRLAYERQQNQDYGYQKSGDWGDSGFQGSYSGNWQENPKSETQGSLRNPYEILGVNPGADFAEIKRAYHRQASKYHPDKVSHLGDEFRALAEEKFKEINMAYEMLKGRHGIN